MLAVFTTVFMSSCEKHLDIEPTDDVDETKALNSSSDVQAALIGAYSKLGSAYSYGGNSQVDQELLGNSITLNWSGTYQEMTQINNKSIPITNSFISSEWTESYTVINTVNNVLDAIEKVEEIKRDQVEGEAKFIRALSYYHLVTAFARSYNDGSPTTNPGVPLVLEPTRVIDENSQLARATVDEVYNQIISDLNTAKEKCLTEGYGFFASTWSASAMLARVYLQKGDYTNAAKEANRVIVEGEDFTLTPTYAESFPGDANAPASRGNTSEEIFSIQVTETSGVNDFNTYFSTSGRGDIDINPDFYSEFDPVDQRGQFFYDVSGFLFTSKYENLYANVTVLRLAEMYLIRAESNSRLGTEVGATPVEDVNEIRRRSGAPEVSNVSIDEIITERRHELAFEGFAANDAKRLEMNVGGLPWNSPKLVYPIPQREMLVNKNLVQNEDY
jgi:hypothetical protein